MQHHQAFFLYTAALKASDAITVLGMWYLCWYLRFTKELFPITKGLPDYGRYSNVAIPLMFVFSIVFHIVGAYRRDRLHFGFRSFKKLVQGAFLATLVFVAVLYFRRDLNYSRGYLLLFPILVIPALLVGRWVLHTLWRLFEQRVVRKISVLLLGEGELLQMYVEKIGKRRPYPVRWVGRVGEPEAPGFGGVRYLGTEDTVSEVLAAEKVDTVVVSYATKTAKRYDAILNRLSNEMVTVKVLPDFGRYSTFTYHADHECGIPLLQFNQPPGGVSDRVMKRVFDVAGSLAFLVVGSPLYLLIAALIKLTSRGPVFYSQLRMGADGRIFQCYKFRSMQVDAESETGPVWARKNDHRTTPLGKWLRKTSLDELPQFYNVLRGDMSLVGPRPERPVFVEQFRREIPKYMLRHKMKSGITGWAQVNGWRGNTSIEERIKYDLFYIGHWSHLFDLKILLMTVWKGFIHRHAY